MATRRWSSKRMRIRSGLFCGSIYWVLLVSGLVSVPKPLSQIQRSTRWLLQGLSPRTSFGGFGLRHSPPQWVDFRECPDPLATRKGQCMYCGRKLGMDLMEVDRKNPHSRGGSETTKNKQLICGTCNKRKGDSTDGEFRRQYKLTAARQVKGPPPRVISPKHFEGITSLRASRPFGRSRRAETLPLISLSSRAGLGYWSGA